MALIEDQGRNSRACGTKKGGMVVVHNEKNELILTRIVTGWQMCIDYRRLNQATRKKFISHYLLWIKC